MTADSKDWKPPQRPFPSSENTWRTAAIALLLFAASLLAYSRVHLPNVCYAGDNLWTIPTALSLLREGDVDLSEYKRSLSKMPADLVWLTEPSIDPRLFRSDGKLINIYPIGTALTILPPTWVWLEGHPKRATDLLYTQRLARQFAHGYAALGVALLFLLLRTLGRTIPESLLFSLLFAFATPHFATHADGLWSHNLALPWILIAFILMIARGGRFAYFSAIPLAMAYITRPDACIYVAAFSICVLLTRPLRQTILFAALGGAIGLCFFAYSIVTYGTLLPGYYRMGSQMTFDHFPVPLLGTLISPSRGLLIYAPLFALSWMGAWLAWFRPVRHIGFFRTLAAIILLHQIMLAATPWWEAGWSFGPRLYSAMLPAYLLLLVPVFDSWKTMQAPRRRVLTAVFSLCVLWGFFVQWRGITEPLVHDWNATPQNVGTHPERLWHWHDMQIFRGMGK